MAIVIGAEIQTDGRELEKQLRRDAGMVENRLGGAFRSVGRIASASFKGIGVAGSILAKALMAPFRVLTSIQAIIGIGLGGLGTDRLIRNASALELRTKALAKQLDVTEKVAGRYISRINAASAGMLDFARASELANQAGILDVPVEKIERLISAFTVLAVARGRQDSIGPDIEELLNSIARGEPPKRFGIFVGAEELQGLKLAAKQAKTLNRTVEELEKRAHRLGLQGDELYLTYNAIFGNIKDIVGEVGRWVVKIGFVRDAIQYVAELTGDILAGLQGDQGKDIAKGILVSIIQLGPALFKTLGGLLEKAFKLGAAALLDILGSLDYAAMGKQVAAAIGRGIQTIAPRLAKFLGIDEKSLAAAEKSSGGVLQRGAAALRESAGQIDALKPIRDLIGDIATRFAPTEPGRQGDLYGVGVNAIELGKVTPEQINDAKRRLKAPFADRFNRILEGMLSDPEVADRYESDPGARKRIRKIAQDKANTELEADKILAGFGSPATLKRIKDANEAAAQNPKNAGLIQDSLEKYLLSTLTEAQRRFLDKYNERASQSDPKFDPIGIIKSQLGLPEDATFKSIIGSLYGLKLSDSGMQTNQHTVGQPGGSDDMANRSMFDVMVGGSGGADRPGGFETAVRRMAKPSDDVAYNAADVVSGGELKQSVEGLGNTINELPGLFDAIGREFLKQQREFMQKQEKNAQQNAGTMNRVSENLDALSALIEQAATSLAT